MQAQTTGWLSLGIGSGMADADIVVASVAGTLTTLEDRVSTRYGTPGLDTEQPGGTADVALVRGEELAGVTTVVFTRALNVTNTTYDKSISLAGPIDVMFAYGASADSLGYHGGSRRGVRQIDFGLALRNSSSSSSSGSGSSTDGSSTNSSTNATADGTTLFASASLVQLSPLFALSWQLDTAANWIEITITAQVRGYVARGIGAGMANADIVAGAVDDVTGVASIGDYYSTSQTAPVLDTDSTNVELVSGSQSALGVTTLVFRRALTVDTATNPHDKSISIVEGEGTSIIYAYSQDSDSLRYHGMSHRGVVRSSH
jgi:hypothetical protein